MISERAIKRFLNRDLQSFEWVKNLKPAQISAALSELATHEDIVGKLWLHQRASLLIMQYQPRFILTLGMGSGKTRIILTHLKLRKLKGENIRAIVFVPYISAVDTWVEEIKKFAPELTCVPLVESSSNNTARLNNESPDLFVVCYASAIYIDRWDNLFDTVILDELHKCGNYKTKTFQLCHYLSKRATYVYGLTGTPFGRDLQLLWAEFYLIDFGETLGPNISFFRDVFFKKKFRFHGGVEFNPIVKRIPHLKKMIKNRSIYYNIKELSDIPEKQYIKIRIALPNSIRSHVERARKELKEAMISRDVKLAGNSFLTLRQLSSGFLTFKEASTDDDTKKAERFKIKFDENPKLDTLIGLIESKPPECKMVVFHDYIETGHLLSERLKGLKIRHARIYGGTRDKLAQLDTFRSQPSCTILLLNSRSGSSALNLQFANYVCFFECPSVIDREQAEARCYRPGQRNKVFIYDLFVTDTIDEQYYNTVKDGGDLLKDFLDGKQEV